MADTIPEEYARQGSIVTKKKVIVHVTFIKIGEIDTLKETFGADVLLRTKWRETDLDGKKVTSDTDLSSYWSPKLFIDNTVGEPKIKTSLSVEINDKGEAYLVERRRVTGTFVEQLELWEFPFDVQDLSVSLMADVESTEVEMVEDPTEIHRIYKQSFIDEQEWYLYKYIESVQSELPSDRADPTMTKCTLTVRCRTARRPAYFIWNIFSVTFLICCLAFVTFSVGPDRPQNRLQLSFTLVLTAVAFKFVVNQCLPKVSYLTYLDRYVLMAMVLLAMVCFWHGIQTLIPESKQKLLDKIAIGCFLGVYAVYNVGFWAKIMYKPYRKRRDMEMKESQYVLAIMHAQEQSRKKRSGRLARPHVEANDPLLEATKCSPKPSTSRAPVVWARFSNATKSGHFIGFFSTGNRHGAGSQETDTAEDIETAAT